MYREACQWQVRRRLVGRIVRTLLMHSNLIWLLLTIAHSSFIASNSFAWDAEFQVFGALKFQGGLQVKSSTNPSGLEFGQCYS